MDVDHLYWIIIILILLIIAFIIILLSKNDSDNIEKMEEIWKIIEQERISGFSHRAPQKRIKKETSTSLENNQNNCCMINIDKINGKININNDETAIIKIRTESMDETKSQFS